jgi:hypothetical protein
VNKLPKNLTLNKRLKNILGLSLKKSINNKEYILEILRKIMKDLMQFFSDSD